MTLVLLSQTSLGNVVGSDLQNFNATTNGIDYVTVQASETLEPGIANLGLMLNYAVNSLPLYEESDEQNRLSPRDSLLMADVLIGMGVLENLELGIAFNRLVRQKIDEDNRDHSHFSSSGWINYRFVAKYRLFAEPIMGMAVIFSYNQNNVDKNPYLGKNQSPIYNLEFAADTNMLGIDLAANVGWRWRYPGDELDSSPLDPTPNQLTSSIGASYLVPMIDTKIIGEVFTSRPVGRTNRNNASRQASSMEAIGGLKWSINNNFAAHVGGGSELLNGVSSPDWRVYGGFNWTFGPVIEWEEKPEPIQAVEKDRQITVTLHQLHFKFGSAQLEPSAVDKVISLAPYFTTEPPIIRVLVEGHTDSIGSIQRNQQLSQERAQAVADALIQHHRVSREKVQVLGYGESRPVADNGNYQGRQKNRRVVIRIVR